MTRPVAPAQRRLPATAAAAAGGVVVLLLALVAALLWPGSVATGALSATVAVPAPPPAVPTTSLPTALAERCPYVQGAVVELAQRHDAVRTGRGTTRSEVDVYRLYTAARDLRDRVRADGCPGLGLPTARLTLQAARLQYHQVVEGREPARDYQRLARSGERLAARTGLPPGRFSDG